MSSKTSQDLGKMKERIAMLLAKAEATTFPEEAETFTAAAEKLMLRLGIVRAELESVGQGKPEEVVEVRRQYQGIFAIGFITYGAVIADGFGHVTTLQSSWKRGRVRYLYLIGTKSDVEELTQLLNSLDLQVMTALKAWRREKADRRRYQTAMQKELADRSFISGFGVRVGKRLRLQRQEQETEVQGTGTELVLVGKDERVKGYMDENYPSLRQVRSNQGSSWEGHAAGYEAGARANLGGKAVGGKAGAIEA